MYTQTRTTPQKNDYKTWYSWIFLVPFHTLCVLRSVLLEFVLFGIANLGSILTQSLGTVWALISHIGCQKPNPSHSIQHNLLCLLKRFCSLDSSTLLTFIHTHIMCGYSELISAAIVHSLWIHLQCVCVFDFILNRQPYKCHMLFWRRFYFIFACVCQRNS